jgi:glutathione S-transferase
MEFWRYFFDHLKTDWSVSFSEDYSMLTFYSHPLSPISRRVWLALLEKGLEFELRLVKLNEQEQFEADFLQLNPFHHVPVLVDGDVKLIESIAILDYLDAQYPTHRMTPETPAALGRMRMIQMVIVNELMGVFPAVIAAAGNLPESHPKTAVLHAGLTFLTQQLRNDLYFGGDRVDLADCVAGVTLPLLRRLGVDMRDYPELNNWMERLYERSSWQMTEPSAADFDKWSRYVQLMIKRAGRS